MPERFASTCVLIDKLDKLPQEEVLVLQEQGLPAESCDLLFSTLALTDLDALAEARLRARVRLGLGLGTELASPSPTLTPSSRCWATTPCGASSRRPPPGCRMRPLDGLVLDLTVVRGLAYYTGIVFEGFDRSGELRAIKGAVTTSCRLSAARTRLLRASL